MAEPNHEKELLHSFVQEFRGLHLMIDAVFKLLNSGEYGPLSEEQLEVINMLYARANGVREYIEEHMELLRKDQEKSDE
jgi:hypothetical protein